MKSLRLILAVVGTTLSAGCYSLQPATAAVPASGTRLVFAINDAGRVALGGPMGPELSRVEGTLLDKQGDEYVVSVIGVNHLNGLYQPWKGESVRIGAGQVAAVYERKFSKTRTVLLVGGAALAAAALIPGVGKAFIDPPGDGGGPVGEASRRPNPGSLGNPPSLRSLNPPRSY